VPDRERVRKAFASPAEFTTSPLYRALSRTVAASDQLLDLAARGQPGQYPTFLFFGAVHRLLLRGTDHPLGGYYPSVVGAAALPAADAGPALESFGRAYAAELAETIGTRLVQTSVVQRTLGLRIGLSAIAAATHAEQSAEKQEDQYRGQVDRLTDASFEGARLNQLSALLTGTSARDFLNKATDLEYLAADNFSTLNKFSVAANTAKAAEQRGQQAKLTAQTAANAATATLAQ